MINNRFNVVYHLLYSVIFSIIFKKTFFLIYKNKNKIKTMKHIKKFNESEEYLNDTFLKDIDYKITDLLNEVDNKLKANEIDKDVADKFFDSLVDYIYDIKDGNTFSRP